MEPPPPRTLSDIDGLSEVCSVIDNLLISMSRIPSLGIIEDELEEEDAEPAMAPTIIMKKMALTMPQMSRPHNTASTHLKKLFVFIS